MAHAYSSSMYIGETTGGIPNPVFYDPHTPIFNSNPPGAIITGRPGSGKTFFALGLAALSSIIGKTTVVIDPKGDFLSLLPIKDEIGNMQVWNLTDSKVNGLLDPFYMAEDEGEKLSLALTVIDIFVGGLDDRQLTVLSPILKDVIKEPHPSLSKVVDELRGSLKEEAKNLGTKLDLIKQMNYSKLCFSESKRKKIMNFNSGLTVITLAGMTLPKDKDSVDGTQDRLALGVIYLLTDFVRRIMKNDNSPNPKTLLIDEAWAIMASKHGASIIKEVALLGRSHGLALILATQNTTHFEEIDIKNTITTRFAFRASKEEADSIIADMGLPLDEGFQTTISELKTGECLMQDYMERYSTVQISKWAPGWAEAFDSNPLKKMEKSRKNKEETDIKNS